MREVLREVDLLLARVPADSIWGRAVKREVLDHLGDSVAEKSAALAVGIFAAIPLVGIAFALATPPGKYAEALTASLVLAADPAAAAQPLEAAALLGLALLGLLLLSAVVVAFAARARAQANSIGLRQAGVGLALLAGGLLLLAHPTLLTLLNTQASGGEVGPAHLSRGLKTDIGQFVLGTVLVGAGLRLLRTVADATHRTLISRGVE